MSPAREGAPAEAAAALIVEGGEGKNLGARIDAAKHLHRRKAGAADRFEAVLLVDVGRRDQETGDAVLDHRGDDPRLHFGGLVGVRDDSGVARSAKVIWALAASSVKNGFQRSLMTGPIRPTSARAGWRRSGCRRNRARPWIARPGSRVAGRTSGLGCRTFETVDFETPAWRATSTIVGRLCIVPPWKASAENARSGLAAVRVHRDSVVGPDQVGGLFRNHDRRCVGVGGNDRRHDRGIGDAQPLKSVETRRASTTAAGSVPIVQVPTG